MQSSYNFELVAISFIVAALASYTALDLTGRIFLLASARLRHACRLGGAAALGVGIWSMHFVAMLAFSLPIPLGYDFATTAFSLGLAIGVSYLALVMTTHTRLTRLRLVASGVLMGFGIAGMHYTGMAAMQMDPGIHLSAGLVFGLAAGDFMKIDVATFQTVWLITFLCSALITTALSRMFAHVGAFRFWAIGFYLLATATACFALHAIWHTDLLLFATATLALQSRILIWAGTRDLFGASAPWRAGLVVTAVFSLLYGSALAWNAPLLVRASLLALFFAPCRAATLYEVYRRRRPRLGPARMLVAVGSVIATLNAIVPLVFVLLDRSNMTLLYGNPRTTSALYAVVFAGDLLLAVGLIVLALHHLIVERDMLATLDRGALARLAESREMRGLRESHSSRGDVLGHDAPVQRQSLPGPLMQSLAA